MSGFFIQQSPVIPTRLLFATKLFLIFAVLIIQ